MDLESEEILWFDQHQWETIDAATARIFPADEAGGGREARVVRFIDRYLSGIDYIFATADGDGFLKIDGPLAQTWTDRIERLREVYREGVLQLDLLAQKNGAESFTDATSEQQDEVLEQLSGSKKPVAPDVGRMKSYGTTLQSVSDDALTFFSVLVLHARQGFYGDPAYGGNKDRVGWNVVGFPGPTSLAATNDLTFSVREYLAQDFDWAELIPHLRGAI